MVKLASLFLLPKNATNYVDNEGGCHMAKGNKAAKRAWTKGDYRTLKAHSKARTPVIKISKSMKRTIGALRQKALKLGIGLGHQR